MLRELLTSDTAVNAPTLPVSPGVGGGDILSLGASVIVIVAIIVVLGWLYSRSRFVSGGANDVIDVVATRALGAKERLIVVEVAEQQLLVGMTATGMQTLHVLEKPVRVTPREAAQGGFAGRLRAAFQEIGK